MIFRFWNSLRLSNYKEAQTEVIFVEKLVRMPLRRWSVSQHGHTVLNICKNLFKAILAILKILVWAGSVKWPLQAACKALCVCASFMPHIPYMLYVPYIVE